MSYSKVLEFSAGLNALYSALEYLDERNLISDRDSDLETCVAKLKNIIKSGRLSLLEFVYYLVLRSDHGNKEALLDDSRAGFIMMNSASDLPPDWIIYIVRELDGMSHLLNAIQYGSIGITLPFLKVFSDKIGVTHATSVLALNRFAMKISQLLRDKNYTAAYSAWWLFHDWLSSLLNVINNSDVVDGDPKIPALIRGLLDVTLLVMDYHSVTGIWTKEYSTFFELDSEYAPAMNIDKDVAQLFVDEVLRALEESLQGITCNVWIDWLKIAENGISMQTVIGNLLYKINEKANDCNIKLQGTLQNCIAHLKIKPFSEVEGIPNSDLKDVVAIIESGNSEFLSEWYAELLRREEFWSEVTCLRVILSRIDLAGKENAHVFLKVLDHFYAISELDEILKMSFLEALRDQAVCETQLRVLSEINRQGLDIFADDKCEVGVHVLFNRVSSHSKLEDVLKYIVFYLIQTPVHVLVEIFKLTMRSRGNHILAKEILINLYPLWNGTKFGYGGISKVATNVELINVVFKEVFKTKPSDKEEDKFIEFLESIKDLEMPNSFLDTCLITTLDEVRDDGNWRTMRFILRVMKVFEMKRNQENAPLFAYLAQLTLLTSWDAFSYDTSKADANHMCLEVAKLFTLKNENEWLLRILRQLPSIVRSHYSRWLPFHDEELHVKLLFQIRMGGDTTELRQIHFPDNTSLLYAIFKIIPILYSNEWIKLFHLSEKMLSDPQLAFQFFSLSVSILAERCCLELQPCTKYCISNFTLLFDQLQGNLPPLFLFKSLLKPLRSMSSSEVQEECYLIMLPVIVKFLKNLLPLKDSELNTYIRLLDASWRERILESINSNS